MSYGPQLPPHLQKQKPQVDSESEEDRDNDVIGPCLPPGLSKSKQGPTSSKKSSDGPSSSGGGNYGPQLPAGLQKSQSSPEDEPGRGTRVSAPEPEDQDDDDDDDDVIGPLPPGAAGGGGNQRAALQLEARAQQMRSRALQSEGEDKKATKRESWMLELPPEKAKSFGLGPRAFSQSTAPKAERDSSWADTPEEKARKAALRAEGGAASTSSGNDDHGNDADVIEYMASLKRDQAMAQTAKELKAKRGHDSLVDMHQKKKAKKASSSAAPPAVRRPFDRDTDLQVNRFDEAAKQAMLKKARKIDERFVSGQSKYI